MLGLVGLAVAAHQPGSPSIDRHVTLGTFGCLIFAPSSEAALCCVGKDGTMNRQCRSDVDHVKMHLSSCGREPFSLHTSRTVR